MKTKKTKPPILYRADILRNRKSEICVSLETIYKTTRISINTQRDAFAGKLKNAETLRTLADYLRVDWLKLHDVNDELTDRTPFLN